MRWGSLLWISLLSVLIGTLLGSVPLSPFSIFKDDYSRRIFLELRLPRTIASYLVGATLAVVGNSFQGLFKNPLVDPYLMGVSAGAAFGASLSISIAERGSYVFVHLAPAFAFLFALIASLSALLIARKGSSVELLLSGVVMNILFSALTLFTLFYMRRSSQGFATWLFGSFSATVWSDLLVPSTALIVSFLTFLFWRKLDAMTLGEDFAETVGVDAKKTRIYVFLLGVIATSATVAKFGSIGFVGLVIPHMARRLFGSSHRISIPASLMIGGIFLSLTDTFSRIVAPPSEVPIGIVTAFVGVPFFLYVMRRYSG